MSRGAGSVRSRSHLGTISREAHSRRLFLARTLPAMADSMKTTSFHVPRISDRGPFDRSSLVHESGRHRHRGWSGAVWGFARPTLGAPLARCGGPSNRQGGNPHPAKVAGTRGRDVVQAVSVGYHQTRG